MLSAVQEIKHNVDGSTERFDCHLLHYAPAYAVLCYVSDKPYAVAGQKLPAGSLTIGHYWRDGDFVLWEMYNPKAEFQGYYIHLCRDVKISDRSVDWYDMTVDVWRGSDGRCEVLDETELERYVKAGHISLTEASRVCQRARELCDEVSTTVEQLTCFEPAELLAALSQTARG